MTVDVILPCLDEAPALPWVLERMPAGFRAIVVDNGSESPAGLRVAGLPRLRDVDTAADAVAVARQAGGVVREQA